MVNVGPAYQAGTPLNFTTATLEQTAQALINAGYIRDSSATKVPAQAGSVGPRHMKPDSTQNLAATLLTELTTALQNVGLIKNSAGANPNVASPDYLTPPSVNFGTVTLAQLLTALGGAGVLANTA